MAEYKTLQETSTFEWVSTLPKGQKAIESHIVFCMKCNSNRNITKYKAWMIAKGFLQVYGQDFTETFSLVAKGPAMNLRGVRIELVSIHKFLGVVVDNELQ